MLPVTGYVSTEDGVRLYFQKLGNGRAVIIPNAIHMFDSFQHLADKRTVIFFDLRNRGNSDSVSSREKLEEGFIRTSTISTRFAGISKSIRRISSVTPTSV